MVIGSEEFYKVLLYLYPSDFRRAYGEDMLQIFRDMHRDAQAEGKSSMMRLWGRTISDVLISVVHEHIDNMRVEAMTTIRIDEYEVKTCVAKGATAHIYLVTDPKNRQDVIMKLWQPEGAFDTETLKREVDAMIALKHQSIPEVFRYVENEKHPYLIMEYIDGETLLQRLESSEAFIDEETLIDWGLQLCDILSHLHSHKPTPYIFRDVKPSNIMIDEAGSLHLIDFGITVPHQINHKYNLIGTEGYSPPEQYKGDIDERSDIFALGATLHQLATKIDPRPDQNPNAQVFTFAPPRAINPDLSRAFAAVLTTATAYEREDRYQSIEAVKSALLACRQTNME